MSALAVALMMLTSIASASEADNVEAREAALAKLDKPLQAMRVKELQALLSERGAPKTYWKILNDFMVRSDVYGRPGRSNVADH